jgi:hypothetical protein
MVMVQLCLGGCSVNTGAAASFSGEEPARASALC